MGRRRGIVWIAVRPRDRGAGRRCLAGSRHARLIGWLAAVSLLVHGWLPILLQVHLAAAEVGGHAYHANAADGAAPSQVPSGEGPECPLFHGSICLCATFVKLLSAPGASTPVAASVVRDKRGRFPASRPPRQRPNLLFDARAPPVSS
jgi:hypothetical protein